MLAYNLFLCVVSYICRFGVLLASTRSFTKGANKKQCMNEMVGRICGEFREDDGLLRRCKHERRTPEDQKRHVTIWTHSALNRSQAYSIIRSHSLLNRLSLDDGFWWI